MTARPDFMVMSPFRPGGASYRTRVAEWLAREEIEPVFVWQGSTDASANYRKVSPSTASYELGVRWASRRRLNRVFVQKELTRIGSGQLERRVRRRADVMIYDFDDAVYVPRPRGLAGDRGERASALIGGADRVIAGNAWLGEHASRSCDDVRVIPTCVDLSSYCPSSERSSTASGPVVIGWMGSPSTERYVQGLMPQLARVQQARGVEVRLVSARGPMAETISGCLVNRRPWSLETQAAELASFDIGIAPSTPGEWEEGKCAYKLLQYGATSLPAVGDGVGVAAAILGASSNLTASSDAEWEEALIHLIDDASERRRLGRSLRDHIDGRYTYDAWASSWRDAVLS